VLLLWRWLELRPLWLLLLLLLRLLVVMVTRPMACRWDDVGLLALLQPLVPLLLVLALLPLLVQVGEQSQTLPSHQTH